MSVKDEQHGLILLETSPWPSQYTYQNFRDLNDPAVAYLLPLAMIALVDMNAFYAQVEQVRLGLDEDAPVVCGQWQSLIAVSYAARKFGINRMDSVSSAREKCPHVIVGHAAVFKKGEDHWKYIPGFPDQGNHKVSLDPYRREGRKILRLFQEKCDLVQKASVDESYLDLGRLVYRKALSLFPQLDSSEDGALPLIPPRLPSSLKWHGDIILSDSESRERQEQELSNASQNDSLQNSLLHDWDDILMLIGSDILLDLRKDVYNELGYKTSGGLARNKLVAKIAAGYRKPDQQTIVRNRLLYKFFTNFQLTDFTGLGGLTGEDLVRRFLLDPTKNLITYLRETFSLEAIKQELPEDPQLAEKLYLIVRGNYQTELTYRVETKSMLSSKNFQGKHLVKTLQDIKEWFRVFAGDLYNRMIELDEENLQLLLQQVLAALDTAAIKRPKTIRVSFTTIKAQKYSRQAPLPVVRSLEKLREVIETIGYKLIKELIQSVCDISRLNNGQSLKELELSSAPLRLVSVIPLINMSLNISNFASTNDSSLIDTYAAGDGAEDARAHMQQMLQLVNNDAKRRKLPESNAAPVTNLRKHQLQPDDKEYIQKMFSDYNKTVARTSKTKSASAPSLLSALFLPANVESKKTLEPKIEQRANFISDVKDPGRRRPIDIFDCLKHRQKEPKEHKAPDVQDMLESGFCQECAVSVTDPIEHSDYHFAKNLSRQLNR